MRTKSKYREFKDGGRVDLPGQDELPIEQPVESAPSEVPAVAVEQPQPETRDEAALALQRQLEELRRSEVMQREHAAVMQPPTRGQKLALWRQTGMSEGEAHFLSRHPRLIDHSDITAFAVDQASQAGHKRGTDAHFDAVLKIFDEQLNHLQGQADNPVMQTPAFFKPPPPPAAPKEAHFVSAPVSREVPGVTRPRGRVTLSREEVEAARVAGISIEEYAAQKRKYQDMRESGEYRDERR